MESTQTSTGTVAGYFESYSGAERALEALQNAGFTSAHLGVARRGGAYGSTNSSGTTSGSTAGQKTEGAWEKVKEFFGGGAEPYAEENTRGDLATREITDESSTSYGNNSRDDFHQNLSGLSVPEDRSRYLSDRFHSNNEGTVVTVNAGSRSSEAEAILTQYGGDLGQNAGSYDYSQSSNSQTGNTQSGDVQDSRNIQLLGEILRVHKDRVNRGDVRIRKEIITENQSVQVPVSREELVIERRAADGNTTASGTIGNSEEIRIPLTEETASVDKDTVVREEVSVGKRVVGSVRDLSGDVRREELVVDDDTKKVANS